MSDENNSDTASASNAAGTKEDPGRYLIGARNPFSRTKLLLILFGAGTLVFVGVVIGFANSGYHPKKAQAASVAQEFSAEPPGVLTAPVDSYFHHEAKSLPDTAAIPAQAPVHQVGDQIPAYKSYAEPAGSTSVKTVQQESVQGGTQSAPYQPLMLFPTGGGGRSAGGASGPSDTAASAPILYTIQTSPVVPRSHQAPTAQGTSATDTAYQKQNQAAEKKQFLSSQTADYGAYLDNSALSPVDPTHEVMAGTVIPITMVTGINSDNPGTIIAQVNQNVYDSITGSTLLIPGGSRLIGSYDNSVSFGQNRLLVAWNRLIRPDGVSIELRGMSGADTSGKAGFSDQVDYHLRQLVGGITLATVFNIGQDIALSALSTASFLGSIASAVIANGSTSQAAGNEIQQVVQQYATKLINQQPTITIRAGYSATVIVNKDILLPAYSGVSFPGGTP